MKKSWNVVIETRSVIDGAPTSSFGTGSYSGDQLPAVGDSIPLDADGSMGLVEAIVGEGDEADIHVVRANES